MLVTQLSGIPQEGNKSMHKSSDSGPSQSRFTSNPKKIQQQITTSVVGVYSVLIFVGWLQYILTLYDHDS